MCCVVLQKQPKPNHRGWVLFLKLPLAIENALPDAAAAALLLLKMLQIYHPLELCCVIKVLSFHTIKLAVPKEKSLRFSHFFSHRAIDSDFKHFSTSSSSLLARGPAIEHLMFDWIEAESRVSTTATATTTYFFSSRVELRKKEKMKSRPRTDGRARNCSLRYFLNQPGGFQYVITFRSFIAEQWSSHHFWCVHGHSFLTSRSAPDALGACCCAKRKQARKCDDIKRSEESERIGYNIHSSDSYGANNN